MRFYYAIILIMSLVKLLAEREPIENVHLILIYQGRIELIPSSTADNRFNN